MGRALIIKKKKKLMKVDFSTKTKSMYYKYHIVKHNKNIIENNNNLARGLHLLLNPFTPMDLIVNSPL